PVRKMEFDSWFVHHTAALSSKAPFISDETGCRESKSANSNSALFFKSEVGKPKSSDARKCSSACSSFPCLTRRSANRKCPTLSADESSRNFATSLCKSTYAATRNLSGSLRQAASVSIALIELLMCRSKAKRYMGDDFHVDFLSTA